MNTLLSNKNLFILRAVSSNKTKEKDIVVINECNDLYNYMKNQAAINMLKDIQNKNRIERTDLARNVLIDMIGKDEFMRLREIFKKSNNPKKKD